jgi:hypothetical protein
MIRRPSIQARGERRVKKLWAVATLILVLAACSVGSSSATPKASPARAKVNPAWHELMGTIRDDGSVSKETALKAFALAIGRLPGVDVPEAMPGSIPDGTPGLRWLVAHWSEITPAQREAAASVIPELKGIAVGTAQVTTETPDPSAAPYVPVAAKSAEIAGQNQSNAFYTLLAEQLAKEIGSRIGPSLGIPITARVGVQQSPTSSMETGVYDGSGSIFGAPAKCVITVSPWADKTLSGNDLRVDLGHEVWHCFEGAIGGLPWYWFSPSWIAEGEAMWVGNSLHPDSPRSAMAWPDYLVSPEVPLFKRSYDAVGFYAQLNSSGTDVWKTLPKSLGKASPAAYVELGANSDAFLDVWASGYLRDPSRGAPLQITGPGATSDRAQPKGIQLPNGASVTEAVAPYTDEIAVFADSPDVLDAAFSGHARISDNAGHDYLLQGGGTFCLKKDGCKCPNAESSGEPPRLRLSGSVALAVTGGPTGASGTLDGMSLDDYCNRGPMNGTWEGTWVNDNGLANGAYTLVIKQKRKTDPFSGTIQVSGKTCVRDGNIQGTLSGQKVTWGVVNAERPIDFSGTLGGKSMSGSWSSIACGPPYGPATGGPYPVTGTWQAKKTK